MHTYDIGKSLIFLCIHNTCEKVVNMIKYPSYNNWYYIIKTFVCRRTIGQVLYTWKNVNFTDFTATTAVTKQLATNGILQQALPLRDQ